MLKFLLFFLVLFFAEVAAGQQGISANYIRLKPTALPTVCSLGDLRVNSGNSLLEMCNGSNTWSAFAVGSATVSSVGFSDGSTTPIYTISGSPVTSSGTLTETLNTQTAHYAFMGPTSGSASQPSFRALAGADLPNPSATTLGGVESITSVSHNFLTSISTSGVPTQAQPACGDLSNSVASCSTDTTNASNISSGTLAVARAGTGAGSFTAYAPITGGTTSTGALQSAGSGMSNSGWVLTSTGSSSLPTFQAPGSPTFSGLTQYGVMYATATTTIGSTAVCTSGQVVMGNGSSAPTCATVGGNSTILKTPTYQTFISEGTTITGNISTANVCVASPSSLKGIMIGSGITDTTHSTALTGGTYVVAIPGTCSAGQIQMSAVAAISETTDTLVFGAMQTTTATISTSSVCLTTVGSTSGVAPGSFIIDLTHSTAITLGTTVVAIPGTCSAGQIQMSAVGAIAETGDSIEFSGGPYVTPTPAPLYSLVKCSGGGGGSSAGNSGGVGGTGGTTYFGSATLIVASGGTGGSGAGGVGGAGGTCTSTLVNLSQNLVGNSGSPAGGTGAGGQGGSGGGSVLWGGGSTGGTENGNGTAGIADTGGGAGGSGASGANPAGDGGGGGGSCIGQVNTPSGSYPLFIGLGGVAGAASGQSAAAGGTGKCVVEEYYQ